MDKKITNICIVDTVYSLLVYLLYQNSEDIRHTFFYFGNGIDKSIREKFNHYYFDKNKRLNKYKTWCFITLRLLANIRWPFINKSNIWAHDHLPYSPYLIGNRDYTYIEDAPYIFSLHIKGAMYTESIKYWNSGFILLKKLRNKIIGDTFMRKVGNNDLCSEVLVTTDDYVSYLSSKRITKISLAMLWANSSESKKNTILGYFNLTNDEIQRLRNKSYILFTQPFSTDGYISEKEQIQIYYDIIKKYDINKLIIKPHPRDNIDYSKYFDGIKISNRLVPMQLINLIDSRFERAITVSSSAVLSFPYEIEIDWYGNSVHSNLVKQFGDYNYNQICNL